MLHHRNGTTRKNNRKMNYRYKKSLLLNLMMGKRSIDDRRAIIRNTQLSIRNRNHLTYFSNNLVKESLPLHFYLDVLSFYTRV